MSIHVKWTLIAFKGGKRITRQYGDWKQAAKVVKGLRGKEVKCHLVSYNVPTWPKREDDMSEAAIGKMWCPYCRAWRWFSIPKYQASAEGQVGTEKWFLNTYHRQSIRICQWCLTSENDFYVKTMNNTWGQIEGSRTRKRRKRKRR